jgi:NTE family protein
MPGVFTPFKIKEEVLFDGGIINPLPTEALFKMGIKKIIAVSVTPSREDLLAHYRDIRKQINSSSEKPRFSLYKYFANKLSGNILDIIFTSIEAMQSEVIEKESKFADIVLHPDTSGLHWLEIHRAKEFSLRGEEEARKNLAKIWQLINQ